MDAEKLKLLLALKPLAVEGGFYAESYRSSERLSRANLPQRYSTDRAFGSAIYYLLTPETFSAIHRLASDEIYHFYLGDPVELLLLGEDGSGEVLTIGPDLESGMRPQALAPRGAWQGSRLKSRRQIRPARNYSCPRLRVRRLRARQTRDASREISRSRRMDSPTHAIVRQSRCKCGATSSGWHLLFLLLPF